MVQLGRHLEETAEDRVGKGASPRRSSSVATGSKVQIRGTVPQRPPLGPHMQEPDEQSWEGKGPCWARRVLPRHHALPWSKSFPGLPIMVLVSLPVKCG